MDLESFKVAEKWPSTSLKVIVIIIIVVYCELSKRNWTIKGKNRDKIKTSTVMAQFNVVRSCVCIAPFPRY